MPQNSCEMTRKSRKKRKPAKRLKQKLCKLDPAATPDNARPKVYDVGAVSHFSTSCRPYEYYHDHFLNHQQIGELLQKFRIRNKRATIELTDIGKSGMGRAIRMVSVSTPSNCASPKFAALIVAGLAGDDCFAVANSLYLVDCLSRAVSQVQFFDYYVIPCLNPDAYEEIIQKKVKEEEERKKKEEKKTECRQVQLESKPAKKCCKKPAGCTKGTTDQSNSFYQMDLSLNFPLKLGLTDMSSTPITLFLDKIKTWRASYNQQRPETLALLRTISQHQHHIKLIVCLREGGETICYPYGISAQPLPENHQLIKVAQKGQQSIRNRRFQYGSIHDTCGLDFGHLIDYLKLEQWPFQFLYNVQVHKKGEDYDEGRELGRLVEYGCDIAKCVTRMALGVFKCYATLPEKSIVETYVRRPKMGIDFKTP